MKKHILVLHGPNLDHLGLREPEIYGKIDLETLNQHLQQLAKQADADLICKQSNSESDLIEFIHQAISDNISHIIINPAAFTHTSIALRDALLLTKIPFIEVHISNIFGREPFRRHSYFSDVAQAVLTGLGVQGYVAALQAILHPFE